MNISFLFLFVLLHFQESNHASLIGYFYFFTSSLAFSSILWKPRIAQLEQFED